MTDMPYPENEASTHWEGCWRERGHHNCAVRRVTQLEERIHMMNTVLSPFAAHFERVLDGGAEDEPTVDVTITVDALKAAWRAEGND